MKAGQSGTLAATVVIRWTGLAAAGVALLAASPRPAEIAGAVRAPGAWVAVGGVDGAVVDVLAVLAWGCLAWLALGLAAAALAHLPGATGRVAARVADAVTPVLLRQAVAALLGVSTLTGVVGTGTASAAVRPAVDSRDAWSGWSAGAAAAGDLKAPSADWPGTPAVGGLPSRVDPGRVPAVDRPRGRDERASPGLVTAAPVRDAAAAPAAVTVLRGDTLWSIAARHLGPQATAHEVASSWPRWHRANRDVIGADPDRLLPGQVLVPPE